MAIRMGREGLMECLKINPNCKLRVLAYAHIHAHPLLLANKKFEALIILIYFAFFDSLMNNSIARETGIDSIVRQTTKNQHRLNFDPTLRGIF